jgi:WD40 repeat protein
MLSLTGLLQGCGSIVSQATPRPPSAPAAAQTWAAGQWTGEPSVSFAVTDDGRIVRFKMVAPFGVLGQTCTIESEELGVNANGEFSIGTATDSPIYVTGKFTDPKTVSGTFKITACGGSENMTVVLNPEEKEWTAEWQGTEVVASAPNTATDTPAPLLAEVASATPTRVAASATPTTAQPAQGPTETPSGPPTLSLAEAIAGKAADVQILGTGVASGNSITLMVRHLGDSHPMIRIERGTVLQSPASGGQDMVVRRLLGMRIDTEKYRPAEFVTVNADEKADAAQYAVEAYSLNFGKENPQPTTHFAVGGAAPAPVSAVLEAVERAPASANDVAAIQSAIWAVTDDVSWDELATRGYAPDQQAVRNLLEAAGVKLACTRLFGVACTPTAPGAAAAPAAPAAPGASDQAAPAGVRASLAALYEYNGSPLAWSPEGKTLYVGRPLTIYDVAARKKVEEIRDADSRDLSVSPDGKLLALASYEEVQIWDAVSRSQLLRLAGSHDSQAVAFSPDGSMLAGATGGALKVWEVATGNELRTIPVGDSLRAVAFSPDGRTVAVGSTSNEITLWDATTGLQTATLKGHSGQVNSLDFSSDGSMLASGSVDQSARLWNVSTGRQARVFTGHTGQVNGVSLSPDGRLLASASWDLTVRLWDTVTGAELQSLTGHTSWIQSVAFSPDGTLLASGSGDGLRLWQIEAGAAAQPPSAAEGLGPLISPVPPSKSAITPDNVASLAQVGSVKSDSTNQQIAWSPDGKLLAIGTYHIYIHDAKTLKRVYAIDSVQWTDGTTFSPDSSVLASAAYEGVKLWDTTGWGELRTLAGSQNTHSVAFRPDGKTLATGTGATVKLWDAVSGKELVTVPSRRGDIQAVAFSPDGKMLAVGGSEIVLLDAAGATQLQTIKSDNIQSLALSPDGRMLASAATNDPVVRLWDLSNGRQVRFFPDHKLQVSSLAFSPDGQILAVGAGLEVKLWEVSSGKELRTLVGYTNPVASVAFSPDGSRLATGGGEESVWLWGAPE